MADADVVDAGTGGSSTAATDAGADTSAGTQNTGAQAAAQQQQQTKEPPFHEHPRFKEVIGQNRIYKQQIETLARELQALKAAAQPKPGADRAPEDQFQRSQAAAALKELIGEDPDLKALLTLAKMAPQIDAGLRRLNDLSQHQQRAVISTAHDMIRALATKNQLSEEHFDYFEDLITGVLSRDPGLTQRFQTGDRKAIEEAWEKISPFISALRKPAAAALTKTKANVLNLPSRPGGGVPGQPAPFKVDPDKPRESTAALHALAEKALAERSAG